MGRKEGPSWSDGKGEKDGQDRREQTENKKKTGVEPNEGQKTQAEPHPMLDNVRRTYLAFTYL